MGRGITAPNRGDSTLVANDDDVRETESDATPISGAYGDADMRALGEAMVSAATDATESIVSSKSEEKHSLAGLVTDPKRRLERGEAFELEVLVWVLVVEVEVRVGEGKGMG